MAHRAARKLLSARHDGLGLHRIVVRVGAVAAWLAAAVYLAAGALTGDTAVTVRSVAPLIAGTLMTLQILVGREDGRVALLISGLVVVIWYARFGSDGYVVPPALAVVIMASLGMLFVERHRTLVAAILALSMLAIPGLWPLPSDERLLLGVVMTLSFVMAFLTFDAIHRMTAAAKTRYQMLFEMSPTAVLEEDWSDALDYVRTEYTGKPERIRQFLLAYPAVVSNAVSRVRVLKANEAAIDLLGRDDPLVFAHFHSEATEHNLQGLVDTLVSLYEGLTSWDHEIPFPGRDRDTRWLQSRYVDTSASVPGGSVIVALADVTLIRERNEAMAAMVRAKDEFIASVSHELRTPLTAVIGLTSELANDPDMGSEERDELLRLVVGQAAEMSTIVEDLLVAARAEMGTVTIEPERVALIDELRATVEGIGIPVEMPTQDPPEVWADPRRIRQILRNLLTNAQRYGGPQRRMIAGATSDRVWLEVRDNGPGVPEEEARHIFEPYVTGHSGAQGSVGLGLAVARQLAELMGGSLTYLRSAGESVFRLELPLADRREPLLASHIERG